MVRVSENKGRVAALAALTLILTACGSSSGSSGGGPGDFKPTSNPTKPLKLSDDPEVFASYLRNGVQLMLDPQSGRVSDSPQMDLAAAPPVAESADNANLANAAGFSATNVHVQGVDEADRVKYDGQYLYVAETMQHWFYMPMPVIWDDEGGQSDGSDPGSPEPGSSPQAPEAPGIRILETHPQQAGVQEVARIQLPERQGTSMAELYLVGDESGATQDLVALTSGWEWSQSGFYHYMGKARTHIDLYDVSVPASPQAAWTLELDGSLEHSRKIDDVLYLVTYYSPYLPELMLREGNSTSARTSNAQTVASTPVEQLLPRYSVNGGATQPLVSSSNCYLPEEVEPGEGNAQLVTIVALDLSSRQILSSVCLNTMISGFYMSTESLYLGSSGYVDGDWVTGVHKFALNQGQVDYRGSAGLPGRIGWTAASFRLDEHNGYLRAVTTDFDMNTGIGDDNGDVAFPFWWGPQNITHYLTVFREQPGSNLLQQVAQIPNDQRPQDIGKPNEDIYAVRFDGDRAYIVTFEMIDPLYVIDLSNPADPLIAGELEVPGFSTYLHAVGDSYLLGVGHDTDDNGWVNGLKVELYDVSDMSNPQAIGTEIINNAWSNAVYDLRALSFFRASENQLRFSLPVTVNQQYQLDHAGLYLYEINGLAGAAATLNSAGKVVARSGDDQQYYYGDNGRSRLHGDTVYYVHDNEVWAGFWQAPESASGPH